MSDHASDSARADSSLPEAFFASAAAYAERTAFRAEGGRGRAYTYAEAAAAVRRFARELRAQGVTRGTEVGLLAENRPEWGIAHLAILAAGGTVVPIDGTLKPQEMGYLAGHCRLARVVASRAFDKPARELPGVTVIPLEGVWEAGGPSPDPAESGAAAPADVAVLIYTSGTTGTPKGVQLTHRNLLANLGAIQDSLRFDESDVFLSVLPLHHTFEMTCGLLTPLMTGCTVVYARALRSKEILEDIGRSRATVMCGVPLLFEKMYHSIRRGIAAAPPGRRAAFRTMYAASGAAWQVGIKLGKKLFAPLRAKAGLDSIRMFVSGGAAMPAAITRFFNLIGFDFMEGYGMSECSPVISVNRPDNIRFGSVGPPLRNVEVRIEGADKSGVGEITVRSEANTIGYRDNPEATAALMRDGWLFTGDLGRFRHGHLWITGRKKNVIVSAAGKNIYPEELEEQLLASGRVQECVVFGRAKAGKQGEEVRAIIVPALDNLAAELGIDPENPDADRVRQAIEDTVQDVNNRVAAYKRITGCEIREKELEKTSSKKVKRYLYQ
ncbi:MAG TPA: AMP-binding protein [candidate division Zixibacteria bacterium]|nr:AMP-binding protein [candidate division Zixibacteria bacterium]